MKYKAALIIVFLVTACSSLFGQQIQRISYVYPAGGEQGTSFEVLLGGRRLVGTGEIWISGQGVTAKVLQGTSSFRLNDSDERVVIRDFIEKAAKRLYPGQAIALPGMGNETTGAQSKEELPTIESIMKKRLWLDILAEGAADEQTQQQALQRFYYEYFSPQPDRFLPDPIGGTLRVKITIAPDALPGYRELVAFFPRTGMITTPFPFQVTPHREVCEMEPNDASNIAPGKGGNNNSPTQRRTYPVWASQELPVQELPVVFNGQIRAGDVDNFTFNAKKGQKLVFVTWGRFLSPYLADGVPGWFAPVLTLFNPQGEKIATADSWRFGPDPILQWEVPQDGAYSLRVQDALFRGRADFVYRIAAGELPFVTSTSTLGVVKEGVPIQLEGWNLPTQSVVPKLAARATQPKKSAAGAKNAGTKATRTNAVESQTTEAKSSGVKITSLNGQWLPCPLEFPIDLFPVVVEKELRQTNSQEEIPVTLPIIIEGKIEQPNEVDVYSFQGKKGEEIVVDLTAIAYGSTLDGRVEVLDETGKILAANDDRADEKGPNIGLETHHADPYLLYSLPNEGTYRIRVLDVLNGGGDACAYRLRLSAPQPDFTVYGTPSAIACRGNSAVMEFIVVRKDGFSGAVKVEAKADTGLIIAAGTIPADLDRLQTTLHVDHQALEPEYFVLEATATIGEKTLVRPVVPADTFEQAFIYFHQVPRETFQLIKTVGTVISARAVDENPVILSYSKTSKVQYELNAMLKMLKRSKSNADTPINKSGLVLNFAINQPKNVQLEDWTLEDGQLTLTLQALKSDDPDLVVPEKGNIIIDILGGEQKDPKGKKVDLAPRGSLPAIPYRLDSKN